MMSTARAERHFAGMLTGAEALESQRIKYGVSSQYIRIEITGSAIVGGSQHTNDVIRYLHRYGYIVEMDDFGSGYSSLNVLKDIELDIQFPCQIHHRI